MERFLSKNTSQRQKTCKTEECRFIPFLKFATFANPSLLLLSSNLVYFHLGVQERSKPAAPIWKDRFTCYLFRFWLQHAQQTFQIFLSLRVHPDFTCHLQRFTAYGSRPNPT